MMSTSKLLDINPHDELIFLHELGKQASCSLKLSNKTDDRVAFRVTTSNPKKYVFTPYSKGFVLPRTTVDVTVSMQEPKKVHPHPAGQRERFTIQSRVAGLEIAQIDLTEKLFNKEESENQVVEFTLWASHIDMMMNTGECQLSFDPQDLYFLSELGKQFSCSVQVFNKSNNYVAFQVRTTNVKRYKIVPNDGVLVPRSVCKVIVTLLALKETPPDMPCKDKFFIDSVEVRPGMTGSDITPELFYHTLSPHPIEKFEMRVFHIDKIMSPGEHIHFEPQNVEIPLRKEFPCSLQLFNKRDNKVALLMNIKPFNQDLFAPTFAYVPARSTCNIRALFPALEEAPPDMQCNDLFHIQSVEIVLGTPVQNYSYLKLFDKKLGHPIDEFMMKACYLDVQENQDVAVVHNISKPQINLVSNDTYKLLHIKPHELIFLHELGKQTSCSLELSNKTDDYVAFKLLTNNRRKYCVIPFQGFVLPRSTVNVTVKIKEPKKIHPHRAGYSDFFYVESIMVGPEAAESHMTPELINKLESGHQDEEFKLPGYHIHTMMSIKESQLNIDPQDLHFLFEKGKEFSCYVQLFNKSDSYIAFRARTTNVKRYTIVPNDGVLGLRSVCKVKVTLKALEEAPTDMQCKDKIFIESVVVRPGATKDDITHELFYYSPRKEKIELRVFHIDKIMSTGEHLHLEPQNVTIPLGKEFMCSLQLFNKRDNRVAFEMKIKPFNQDLFAPTFAFVPARSTCNIRVFFLALEEAPPEMQCNDLFHIQSVELVSGTPTNRYSYTKLFDKKLGHPIDEFMMKACYLDVEENQDVAEHSTATVKNIPKPQSVVSNETSGSANGDDSLMMSTSKLLDVKPHDELIFLHELGKQASCPLKLSNKTDDRVAFRVLTFSFNSQNISSLLWIFKDQLQF